MCNYSELPSSPHISALSVRTVRWALDTYIQKQGRLKAPFEGRAHVSGLIAMDPLTLPVASSLTGPVGLSSFPCMNPALTEFLIMLKPPLSTLGF